MQRQPWSAEAEQRLRALYPNTPMHLLIVIFQRSDRKIYAKANHMGLARSPEFLAGPHAGRLTGADQRGKDCRFQPGQVSWNKGKKGWQAGGRSHETRFKKGAVPHTWRPIGFERVTRDGYLERKVTDTGCTRNDFVAVHRLVWQEHFGEIPPGHVVVFRDALPKHINITIDRLELINRAELARRNSIHRYPPELKKTIRLVRKLERKLKEKSDERQDD